VPPERSFSWAFFLTIVPKPGPNKTYSGVFADEIISP
jgi:hypothetical protein